MEQVLWFLSLSNFSASDYVRKATGALKTVKIVIPGRSQNLFKYKGISQW